MKRFIKEYGIPEYDAGVLTAARPLAEYYENVVSITGDPKFTSNWMMTELLGVLNDKGLVITECPVSEQDLAGLLKLVKNGAISARTGKDVFKEMFESGKSAEEIIKEKDLSQVSDEGELSAIVEKVIAENAGPADDFRNGKEKALGFLVGQVMRQTKGKANPAVVNKLLVDKLK